MENKWIYTREKSYDGKQMADILGQMIDTIPWRSDCGISSDRFDIDLALWSMLIYNVEYLELETFVTWRVPSRGLVRVDFGTCMICSAYTLHEI
jgi:hypothetical protein